MSPVISVVIDTRRPLASGKYPIKLRATFKIIHNNKPRWIQKHIPLQLSSTLKEYNSALGNPRTAALKKLKQAIIEAQARAQKIIDENKILTLDKFVRLYQTHSSSSAVASLFDQYIHQLTAEGRIGNAMAYRQALASVTDFGGAYMQLVEINSKWLRLFEAHMIGLGRSRTTIGMYLRCLRTVFNIAIDDHLISRDLYPFGRKGYTIPKGIRRNLYLDEPTKNNLLKYQTKNAAVRKALDFFIFSYFCNGMNFADIAYLKRADITSDSITFIRRKSARSSSTSTPIVVPLRPEILSIIARHGTRSLKPSDYVFPILTTAMSPVQQKNAIKQFVKITIKHLKPVAEYLDLPFKLTTNIARHTFATIALRKGASKEFIQEAFGHTSMATTENYLGGLDFETKKAIADKL